MGIKGSRLRGSPKSPYIFLQFRKDIHGKGIIIKGARQNNLKNIDLTLPRNQLIVSPDCPARENRRWLLTPSMRKGSENMSSPCLPMRGSS